MDKYSCRSCGRRWETDVNYENCPTCGSPDTVLENGDDDGDGDDEEDEDDEKKEKKEHKIEPPTSIRLNIEKIDRELIINGYPAIRAEMLESLKAYVEYGRPVGDFLKAVIENDLVQSYARADDGNTSAMHSWAYVMYQFMPVKLRGEDGYKEHLEAWREYRTKQMGAKQ